jgi:hypothetical protein
MDWTSVQCFGSGFAGIIHFCIVSGSELIVPDPDARLEFLNKIESQDLSRSETLMFAFCTNNFLEKCLIP